MPTNKQYLEALHVLKDAGYEIPDEVIDYVKSETLKDRGVKQLWVCKKCGWEYESFVKVTTMSHPCEKAKTQEQILLSKVWEAV